MVVVSVGSAAGRGKEIASTEREKEMGKRKKRKEKKRKKKRKTRPEALIDFERDGFPLEAPRGL